MGIDSQTLRTWLRAGIIKPDGYTPAGWRLFKRATLDAAIIANGKDRYALHAPHHQHATPSQYPNTPPVWYPHMHDGYVKHMHHDGEVYSAAAIR